MNISYPAPTVESPSLLDMDEMADEGQCYATDGCVVETDGQCEHGHVSWMVFLGWI